MELIIYMVIGKGKKEYLDMVMGIFLDFIQVMEQVNKMIDIKNNKNKRNFNSYDLGNYGYKYGCRDGLSGYRDGSGYGNGWMVLYDLHKEDDNGDGESDF